MTDKNNAVDSREKLEADVKTYLDLPANCRNWGDFGAVIGWLDRQAAITERETLHANPMCAGSDKCPATNRPISESDERETPETAENGASKDEIRDSDVWRVAYEIYCAGGYVDNGNEPNPPTDGIRELLDRQKAITKAECDKPNWDYCDTCVLVGTVDKLKAERDDAVEAYDAHMAAHDAWHEAEDITYTRNRFSIYEQVTKERIARLESERDALRGDLVGACTSRDHWRHVAGKHAAEMQRLRKALKAANEYGTIWPRFEDGAVVKFGDEIEWSDNGEPKAVKVSEIKFERYFDNEVRSAIRVNNHTHTTRAIGKSYKRAPLKAADGKPIEEGTLLYGGDGSAWLVESIDRTQKYPIEGSCDGEYKRLKPEWLTHEKPKDSLDDVVLMLRCCPGLDGRDCDVLADRIEKIAKEAGQ